MSEKVSLLSSIRGSDVRANVEELAEDVKAVRESLAQLIGELDGRVRKTLDPFLRRRHPLTLIGLGGAAFVAGGLIARQILRRNAEPEAGPIEKARRVGRAMARIVEDPDRVAQPMPGIARDIMGAVGAVLAAAVARAMVSRAWSRD